MLVVVAGVVASSLLDQGLGGSSEPLTDQTVVAQLGSYQKAYPESLRTAVQAARANPGDMRAAIRAARSYIAYGRQIGDARLVGTALGLLSPWLKAERPNPEVQVLAATALQYTHDFKGALSLLDRALAAMPDYADALLIRADLDIVQGRVTKAQQACQTLPALGRIDLGLICDATARSLTPDASKSYNRLAAFAALKGTLDDDLRAYASGLLGEIAAFHGWRDKAKADLTAALTTSPDDLRTKMVYADFLLSEHDPAAALAIIEQAPPTDGILLRRAIAYRDMGDTDSIQPLAEALQRTFDIQRQLGLNVHAREEARFQLEIVRDPLAALDRALANWETQREWEDAQLLLDAADAAGTPMAARPVIDWVQAEGLDPKLFRIPDALKAGAP